MKKSELSNLSTEEIIELIRSHRRIENVKIKNSEDRKMLLAEIIRREAEGIPDGILKDILSTSLPAYPNGDYQKRSLHIRLADATTLENDKRDWSNFSDEDIMTNFQANVRQAPNCDASVDMARSLYTEIYYRDLQKKVSDSTYYSYIVSIIPKHDDPEFRNFAMKLLKIISD